MLKSLFSGWFSDTNKAEPAPKPKPVVKPVPPPAPVPRDANFHVTMWPTFPHFHRFANDDRVQGIRLNSAMIAAAEIDSTFKKSVDATTVPLYFDVKGMQLRIKEVICGIDHDHLEFRLNRPVKLSIPLPCPVYFKAGEDCGKLIEIRNGDHFIFEGGPRHEVREGESIHIHDTKMFVGGPPLMNYELEKIDRIKQYGFNRWYLSYVYSQKQIDAFREVIGPDDELILKIENIAGLDWVARYYKPQPHTTLMAARGDLFIEVGSPHNILSALKLIISKDRNAFVGSRMLLSIIPPKMLSGGPITEKDSKVPNCADFCELAWLYDIGYRNFLLCDEICLKEFLVAQSVNIFSTFRDTYCKR